MPPQPQRSSLPQYCTPFISEVRRFYPHTGEVQRFSDALGEFIGWSVKQSQTLRHLDGEGDQKVVSFVRRSDGAVLWAAHPRRGDGARFEILPRAASKLPPAMRQEALEVIRSISTGAVAEDAPLRIPFIALKNAESRRKVIELLGRLLGEPTPA